jgi:hypothetical protein
MSQRERPAPRGHPASGYPAGPPSAPAGNGTPLAWDDLYDRLPPDQRARVIAGAAAGVVAADQVPPPPAAPPPHLLHRLLIGEGLDDLPAIPHSDSTNHLPADLDSPQRAAVSLALRTPDIALVQGRPGAGQDRVTAAAIAAAARRGERMLLIASTPAGVDRVLDLLADQTEVCALRCVGRDESSAQLSKAAAACTFTAHTHRLTEQTREHAQSRIAAAVETCRRRDAEAAVYDPLLDLAEQHHRLHVRRAELPALRDGIAAAVELILAEPTDADRDRAAALARCDAELMARQADTARARQAVVDLDKPLAALRPLATARSGGRWWTLTWWQARSAGDVTSQLADLEAKHRQAETYAATIEAEAEQIAKIRADLVAEHDRQRDARRQAELDRRRTELDDQAVAIDRELALVADKWQQAVRQLPANDPRPNEFSAEAATAVRDAWGRSRDIDRRDLDFARAWADGLEPLLEALPGRLLEAVNLVAGTPASLMADAHFGDGRRGLFDLLIVLDAHAFTDGDLMAAARRARRWVLIGEPAAPERNGTNGSARSRSQGRGGFTRLWQLLHCDPWGREGQRVVCRLRRVPPDRRGRLDREPVADRPDVELRIHTPPGGTPELAEVAFPVGTAIGRAVEYVFAELGELPCGLSAECRVLNSDSGAGLSTQHSALNTISIDLGDGVRVATADAPGGWDLLAVEFTPSAGWDRERAAAWVHRHVVQHGPARTVRLSGPSAHASRETRR